MVMKTRKTKSGEGVGRTIDMFYVYDKIDHRRDKV